MELMTLIRRIQNDEWGAFESLFEQYKNLVYRTAYLMLEDGDEAEEALQEVFLQVYRAIDSYRPEKGAFTTWLYRVTANHCTNRRRKKKFIQGPLSWLDLSWREGSVNIESHLDQKEPIEQALQRLSGKVRDVIILRYYGDLSYAEIAESLKIPVGTVKSRLDWGLRELRRELRLTEIIPGIDQAEAEK